MILSNPIKAVLFDLDGTLRHHIPAAGDVFVDYARSMGLHISEEDHIRAEHWVHHYFAFSLELQADGNLFKDDLKGFWLILQSGVWWRWALGPHRLWNSHRRLQRTCRNFINLKSMCRRMYIRFWNP